MSFSKPVCNWCATVGMWAVRKSLKKWSRGRELNSRPVDYESTALPLSYLGLRKLSHQPRQLIKRIPRFSFGSFHVEAQSGSDVTVPQDGLNHLRLHAQCVKIGRQRTAELVPALPLRNRLIQLERMIVRVKVLRIVADGTPCQQRNDHAAHQIRKVHRSPTAFSRKHPVGGSQHLPQIFLFHWTGQVVVIVFQHRAEYGEHWNRILAGLRPRQCFRCPPHRSLHRQFVASKISPLQSTKFRHSETRERGSRYYRERNPTE